MPTGSLSSRFAAMVEIAPSTFWGIHLYVISSHYAERHFNVFCFKVSRGSWDKA